MITYQIESWTQYHRDCQELWREDFEEIAEAGLPLRPNVVAYETLESFDKLQIVTARDGEEMVGFHIAIIAPHMHHADILCGFQDSLYLSKSHRRGMTAARRLIETAEAELGKRGVKRLLFTAPPTRDSGRFLERLGYHKSDTVYSKWLED